MRKPWRLACLLSVCLLALASTLSEAHAQISVRGGNPTLSITTGFPGSEPIPVVNVATSLRYRRQAQIAKITVTTSCPGQSFTLKVLATNIDQGVAAPEVTLFQGMLDTDVITNIPSAGFVWTNATLQYTASATFADGNSAELGNDVHTVTYTLQVQ
ncbi:MAG: hypothetical protein FJ217_14875 [Ignavibacteria bacterium]|nr:hypothetical protein [Ignavibacteria bacterium]